MSTLTLTKAPLATEVEVVPDFDRTDGDEIGDEILLESAKSAKVGTVAGGRGAFQSADSRAWTRGGSVD